MCLIWIPSSLTGKQLNFKKCVMAENHNQGSVDKNDATSKPPFSYVTLWFSQICLKYCHKTVKYLNTYINPHDKMWPCSISGNTGIMNNIALDIVTCFNFTDCFPQFSCGHGKRLNVFLYINDALSV